MGDQPPDAYEYSLPPLLRLHEQPGYRHLQRPRNLLDVVQRDVDLAPLDGPDVGPVQVACVGEALLGETGVRPKTPDGLPELLAQRGRWHAQQSRAGRYSSTA